MRLSTGFYMLLKSSSGLLEGEIKVILLGIWDLVGVWATIDLDIILSLWEDRERIEGVEGGLAGDMIVGGET